MTAEPDLLPCPFCGGTPVLRVPQLTDGYAVHIRCRCGVEMYGSRSHFATGGEAITAWNTRATAARDAEVEALRAEVERLKAVAHGFVDEIADKDRRAERLAEALRGLLDAVQDIRGIEIEDYCQAEVAAAQAALNPTSAQENDDA